MYAGIPVESSTTGEEDELQGIICILTQELSEGFTGLAFKDCRQCPICNSATHAFRQVRTINTSSSATLDLCSCVHCGHWFINPLPTQLFLDHLYRRASYSVIGAGWEADRRLTFTPPERFVIRSEAHQNPGRYFELGVGHGLLYRFFQSTGWMTYGVEPGPWGKSIGLASSLDELEQKTQYDVIVALDVIEHVSDPIAVIKRLLSLTAQNARVYFSFPNSSSLRARIFREAWRMVRPLGHIHYFSKRSAHEAFNRSGLHIAQMRTSDLAELRNCFKSFGQIAGVAAQTLGLGDQLIGVATRGTQ
jgi:hypothetical protein